MKGGEGRGTEVGEEEGKEGGVGTVHLPAMYHARTYIRLTRNAARRPVRYEQPHPPVLFRVAFCGKGPGPLSTKHGLLHVISGRGGTNVDFPGKTLGRISHERVVDEEHLSDTAYSAQQLHPA